MKISWWELIVVITFFVALRVSIEVHELNKKPLPNIFYAVKDYGCNLYIIDFGNGYIFLNGSPEGDGRMFHNREEAIKVGDRLNATSKCVYK